MDSLIRLVKWRIDHFRSHGLSGFCFNVSSFVTIMTTLVITYYLLSLDNSKEDFVCVA